MTIRLKRVYEPADRSDGYRVLADRLWPRGISKESLLINEWCKDVAPSTELRTAYHSGELDFKHFSVAYLAELAISTTPKLLLDRTSKNGDLTLLFAAKNAEQNHAIVLRDYLETYID